MANPEQYEEAKRLFAQICHELDTQPLTKKQRDELQEHATALAGFLCRPWLPLDWKRRLVMVGIVLLGLQQAIVAGNYQPFLWWLLLPTFSPRIMGECAYAWGRLTYFLWGPKKV